MSARFLLALLLLFPLGAFAQDALHECFPKKDDSKLVYDVSGIFSSEERQALEQKLDTFALNTSNQIVVVVVDDLCGYDKSAYATELIEYWGIGQAKQDNGIVVLVKPKTLQERGETFIATGRGLEGAIPDASVYLIVENELIPYFKQGDYFGGVNQATNVLMELARLEYSMADYAASKKKPAAGKHGFTPILFLFFVMAIFFGIKSLQVRRYARRNGLSWLAAFALMNAARTSHKGYWDDFNSGRGGFGGGGGFCGGGGFGGGGFGGFGGGSSGGGGAGGSW